MITKLPSSSWLRLTNYYDYYDFSQEKQQAAALYKNAFAKRQAAPGSYVSSSDPYGSYSSKYSDCDNGLSLGLLVTALMGIGVMFFTLFTKITMGRKKRSMPEDPLTGLSDPIGMVLDRFQELVFGGKTHLFLAIFNSLLPS